MKKKWLYTELISPVSTLVLQIQTHKHALTSIHCKLVKFFKFFVDVKRFFLLVIRCITFVVRFVSDRSYAITPFHIYICIFLCVLFVFEKKSLLVVSLYIALAVKVLVELF